MFARSWTPRWWARSWTPALMGALVGTGTAGALVSHRDDAEALARHLHDERVEAIAPDIAGPDEIATGDVEIALGKLRVVVTATAGVEIGHDRRDHEDAQRAVQGKAEDLVGAGPLDAGWRRCRTRTGCRPERRPAHCCGTRG